MVAFKRAITRVQDHNADINSLEDLDRIYGIGPAIKEYLKEYFKTGNISEFEDESSGKISESK